ncbi:hypothetical protein VCRA2133E348_210058 [Vibrio crassostreae]|nr:hypothetical protein VCRA2119O48_200060 [Vibrio crassostreae]CAK2770501.1 hypothetical protein VCRA2133E348_210058 [Vibrio crassostreae]CAK3221726.1 hypothetical protein VCRA213O314_190041 [Vibrio crassostreae]
MLAYPDLLALKTDAHSPYYLLKKGYDADYQKVTAIMPFTTNKVSAVYVLPSETWARRRARS